MGREGQGREGSGGQELVEHGHAHPPGTAELRVRALETVLTRKGLVEPEALDEIIEAYEQRIGPHLGARVVARAWADPAYRARLLEDATAAIRELGIGGLQGTDMVVLECTPSVHHLTVCTLCSCYPWPLLGLPPRWYKSPAYRARAVREPRRLLAEMGLTVPESVEIRVWDSTAELRYLVLPERPPGTGAMDEEGLATLVTRDAMIGVARALMPGPHSPPRGAPWSTEDRPA